MKRYIFPEPLEGAACALQPDSMATAIVGQSDHHPSNNAPCVSFDVPASVPNMNGARLTISWPPGAGLAPFDLHGILDTLTVGGGGYQVDVFKGQKAGSVRPFYRDGHFCRYSDDGSEMLINLATGFRAFCRFVYGEFAQLDAFMASCVALNINCIRVCALQDTSLYLSDPRLQYRIHPADHPNFLSLVQEFNAYAAGFGIYVKWVICTQTQTLLPAPGADVRFIQSMFDALFDFYCLVSKVNEHGIYDNSISPEALMLERPGMARFLLSTGSKESGNKDPLLPIADFGELHNNDLSEWWRKGHNAMEIADAEDRPWLVSESTRTDKHVTDVGQASALIHYEDDGNTQTAMTMGSIIHTPEGKNADAFDFSVPHIQAHNKGVFAGGLNARRGPYARYDNPNVLRDYSMGGYRWQVRF